AAATVLSAPPFPGHSAPPGPAAATVLSAPPLGPAAPSALSQTMGRLMRRLRDSGGPAELLRRAREVLRGREILLLIPLFFLIVLLIVIVLDMQDRPQLQPLQPSPRLQIIDGQR